LCSAWSKRVEIKIIIKKFNFNFKKIKLRIIKLLKLKIKIKIKKLKTVEQKPNPTNKMMAIDLIYNQPPKKHEFN
jgi:hypothetical protein